jgi:hypothetical protein
MGCTHSFQKEQVIVPLKLCETKKDPPRKKKNIPKAMKRVVWDTYIGAEVGLTKCLCCQHADIRQIEFHCGHVVAEANGGTTTVDNLRPICAQCNLSMGKKDMNEFMKMFKKKE